MIFLEKDLEKHSLNKIDGVMAILMEVFVLIILQVLGNYYLKLLLIKCSKIYRRATLKVSSRTGPI